MADHLEVAIEYVIVRDVEAGKGCVKPNVGLGDVLAKQVGLMCGVCEMSFEPVKGFEQRVHICVVGLLRHGKSTLVYAVIDSVVDPFVHFVNLFAQMLRVEAAAGLVGLAQVGLKELVKAVIQHANDLAGLIVYDGVRLLVP